MEGEAEGKEVLPVAVPEKRVGLEVGDTVVVLGGQMNETVGKVYGFSTDRLLIMPRGVTDRVIRIRLENGKPAADLGIAKILILKKAPKAGFVTLIDLRAGQYVETFGSDLNPKGIFKVVAVNETDDSTILEDEGGGKRELIFAFKGISPEEPFEVMRAREAPPDAEEETSVAAVEEAEPEPVPFGQVEEDDILQEGQAPSISEEDEIGEAITLYVEAELEEVTTANRIYDDTYQRSELLSQLILLLPRSQRRDPLRLQEVRRTVEQFLLLRNDAVAYNDVRDPSGPKSTSVSTLAELITRPSVYLSRKVANVSKVVYADNNKDPDDDPDAGLIEKGLYGEYLSNILKRAKTLEAEADVAAPEGQVQTTSSKFFNDMEKYRKIVQSPYVFEGRGIPVEHDEEAFRIEIPDVDEPALSVLAEIGRSDSKKDGPRKVYLPPAVSQVPFSLVRLLGPRKSRFLKGEAIRTVEPAEEPSYSRILVFPLSTLRNLGPIRSGLLAQDMSLAAMQPKAMRDIVEELKDISEFPTAESILNIDVRGNIVGNVTIKDWLTNLPLNLEGMGDAWRVLHAYGAGSIEWTAEQAAVIQAKIEQRLAGLRLFMSNQREENKVALANMQFSPEGLIKAEDAARLVQRLESEPIMKKLFDRVKEYLGDLAAVDVYWFSMVFLTYPDMFLSVLGGQPEQVVKDRMRVEVDLFNKQLRENYLVQKMRAEAPEPVEENTCPHMKVLEAVRKVAKSKEEEPRDVTKIKLLVKVLNEFRGKTSGDWIDCKVCEKHLMCSHELVFIQEFIRPSEKDALHKELIIHFSGGQFSGRFICRVCGQGIANLDFDQSLEFDDEGRPMMGRSVMVDREAIQEEAVKAMLEETPDADEKGGDEAAFGKNAEEYKVLKRIASGLGIDPEKSDFRTMMENLTGYMTSLPSRRIYEQAKKKQDYDIYRSLRLVCAAGAVVLLSAQSRIPDYLVYYTTTDCKDGYYGYPLEEGAGAASAAGAEPNLSGIRCVAGIIAGVNDNEAPWNLTTLQTAPSLKDNLVSRRDYIVPFIKALIDEYLKQPMQQANLKRKREYRTKLFGKVGGLKSDQISKSFRPVPFILTDEEAAKNAVMGESAAPDKQATAWIRMAHQAARTSAAINPDAPTSDTTSCLHPVRAPFAFWKEQALPPLEGRATGQTSRSGMLTTTFYTEMPKGLEGSIDPKDYYKLFANLCWQGDNKGLPHKLGLTLSCSECGLNFKTNPNIPFTVEGNPKKAQEEESKGAAELQAHIVSQGLVINEDTAKDLLATARMRVAVEGAKPVVLPAVSEGLVPGLSSLKAEPFPGWGVILGDIQVALIELGPGVTRIQIAKAAEKLVDEIGRCEAFVMGRLGANVYKYVESLTLKTPRECGEALRAFVLVPFKRWLTGLDTSSFQILDSYELSSDTKDDIMKRGLGEYLKVIGNGTVLEGMMMEKTKAFVEDLTGLCTEVFPRLRAGLIVGGEYMMRYLMRAYVMGTVKKFVDPTYIPGEGGDEMLNMKVLYTAFAQAMTKYAVGAKVPSEGEIRFALERRAEKEKQVFIGEIDAMSADKRRVELTLKALGMGKWAAGGSKAIRQYDSDRYEVERAERAAAGIVDYGHVEGAEGRAADMFGLDFGGAYDAGGDRMDGDYTDGAMREDEY